jgi:NTP pyrophosphatase (non-canonical NTP hydrolase)
LSAYTVRWKIYKLCANHATKRKLKTKGKNVRLNEYQRQAYWFAVENAKTHHYLVPALAEEVGEVAALFAKSQRKGVAIERAQLLSELGDVLWNVASLAELYGLTLEDVAQHNLDKLISRKMTNTIVER